MREVKKASEHADMCTVKQGGLGAGDSVAFTCHPDHRLSAVGVIDKGNSVHSRYLARPPKQATPGSFGALGPPQSWRRFLIRLYHHFGLSPIGSLQAVRSSDQGKR